MVFSVQKNGSDKNSISFFGKTLSDFKKQLNDIKVITRFNQYIDSGIDSISAFENALKATGKSLNEISEPAAKLMQGSKNAKIDVDEFADSVNRLGTESKNTSIAMNLLTTAGNIALTMLASAAVQYLSDLIHAQDILEDISGEAKQKFEESNARVSSLNIELEDTKALMEEMEGRSLSVIEQDEYDRLVKTSEELERQIKLEEKLNEIAERESRETASDAIEGKKQESDASSGFWDQVRNPGASVYKVNKGIVDALGENSLFEEYASYDEILDAYYFTYAQRAEASKDSLVALKQNVLDAKNELNSIIESDTFDPTSDLYKNAKNNYEQASNYYNEAESFVYDYLSYLKSQTSGLSRVANPETDEHLLWNSYFDEIDEIERELERTIDSTKEYEFNDIITRYSDAFSQIKEIINQSGSIDADTLINSFGDVVDRLRNYGWSIDEIVAQINTSYGSLDHSSTLNTEPILEGYESIRASMEASKPALDALTAALEEQASAGQLTAATYENLVALDSNYANFLEKTASGYMLNTDAVYNYLEAQNQLEKGLAIARIMELQELMTDNTLSDEAKSAYQAEISQLQVLIGELDSATGAYERYARAKETANQDAMFQGGKTMYEEFKEANKTGKTGTDEFQESVNFALGDEWETRFYDRQKAYDEAEKVLKRYFGQEDERTSAANFLKDLGKNGFVDDDGALKAGTTIEGIANKLNTSEDMVRSIFGLLDTYEILPEGFSFEISDEDKKLAEKATEIEKAKERVAEINAEIETLKQELASVQEGRAEGSQYLERIAQLEAQLQGYEAIINAGTNGVNVETKSTLEEVNKTIDLLQTIERDGLDIDLILGGDWDDLKKILQMSGNDPIVPSLPVEKELPVGSTFANGVSEGAAVISTKIDKDQLADEVKEAAKTVEEDSQVTIDTSVEEPDDEFVFDIDQNAIDSINTMADRIAKIAEFRGFGDTFEASALESSASNVNKAWNELQSIEDTSSPEFAAATHALSLAVIDFANARSALYSVMEMPQSIDIQADTSDAVKAINALGNKTVTIKVRTTQVEGYASGTRMAKGGTSLVDEEGAELIEHKSQGTYELGTNQGARFTNLQPGDVVHTAEETKKILSRVAKIGGAFATGLSSFNVFDAIKKLTSKTVSSSSSSSSSSKSSSASSNKSSAKKVSDKNLKKYIEKLFDWIEIRLEALQRITDDWIQSAKEAVGYISKNASLDKALANISKQINESTQAYNKYMLQADTIAKKAGLSSSIIQKIQNGSIEIASYDDKTQEKIKYYQEWLAL